MTGICQVVDSADARVTCPVSDSGGYRCEEQGTHVLHRVGEHTIGHALAGNGYTCSAIISGDVPASETVTVSLDGLR